MGFKLIANLALLLFTSNSMLAQGINGKWTGNYSKRLLNPKSLVVEIFISDDSIISGSSHLYYNNQNYEHHAINGKFNKIDSSLKFSESLEESSREAYEVVYDMKLKETDSTYILSGKWFPKKGALLFLPIWNGVNLTKPKIRKESIQSSLVLNRQSSIQKFIEIKEFEKDSIKISAYDNGTVDNDSISMYFNDSLIISNKMISASPISFYISLSNNIQFQKIKLIADNLGTIPPNTALLIIETKLKRYEVNLKSDLRQNGVVEFILLE